MNIQQILADDVLFAQTFLRVVSMSNRDTLGSLVPFRADNMPMQADFIQRVLQANIPRAIELKARRVGGTTLFMALGLTRAMLFPNYNVVLIAQSEPEAIKFGRMWKRLYEDMVDRVRLDDGTIFDPKEPVGIYSDHMIEFPGRGSSLIVGTAGSTKFGRGGAFNMVIGTEVAQWDIGRPIGTAEQTWAMAEGALVPRGLAILESTAFGAGGFFYNMYTSAKRGENGWLPLFYSWPWHPIYSLDVDDPETLLADRGEITLTDEESALGITPNQARWRRSKLASMPGSTYESKRSLFLQEYPENDITCFAVSGNPFFDTLKIEETLQHLRPTVSVRESGTLRVWQAPRVGEHYVIGVDPGGEVDLRGGRGQRDFEAAMVVDSRGEHVATLHGQWGVSQFAEMVAALGKQYNNAYVIVENGAYGNAVLLVLNTTLRYSNLYTERDKQGHPIRLGKLPTESSKVQMADNYNELFSSGAFHTNDSKLLEEMRNYHRVPSETGHMRLRAIAGHDDLVSATMYALWAWQEGGWREKTRTRIWLPGKQLETPLYVRR